jgi:hypothetical protein
MSMDGVGQKGGQVASAVPQFNHKSTAMLLCSRYSLTAPKRRPSIEEIFANAPVDDESLTEPAHAAITEARDDVAAG